MEIQTKKIFTQKDFIKILLPMLFKKGITKINEDSLSRKLYEYYQKPEYKELFGDISKSPIEDKVDISEAMYNEKYFSQCARKISANSEILFLSYYDYDNSYYENKIDKEKLQLIEKIADDLVDRYKIESSSRHYMNIYCVNPDNEYLVMKRKNYSWQLITDGSVEDIETMVGDKYTNFYFEQPLFPNSLIPLKDGIAKRVKVENASYVIMQGSLNGKLEELKIYTTLNNLEDLRKISEIANNEYEIEETQTKKLVLK